MSALLDASPPSLLEAAFDGLGVACVPSGPSRWVIADPRWPRHLNARLDSRWLEIGGPLPDGAERHSPWDLLDANAHLAGPSRFALGPDRVACLCAELPRETEGLAEWARAFVLDLGQARELLERSRAAWVAVPPAGASGPEPPVALDTVRAALESAGWSFTQRSETRLMVPLEVPDAFVQASVTLFESGRAGAAVEIGCFERLSPLARRALGTLLLSASGLVRLARPEVRVDEEERCTVAFATRLATPVSVAALDHALNSLTAAARLCGREVEALTALPLARTFLHVHRAGSREIRLSDAPLHNPEGGSHGTE